MQFQCRIFFIANRFKRGISEESSSGLIQNKKENNFKE